MGQLPASTAPSDRAANARMAEMTRPSSLRGAVESDYFMTEENARNFYRRWSEFIRATCGPS